MTEHKTFFPAWKSLRADVIAWHCVGFTIAFTAGVVIAGRDWAVHVSAMLTAFLGAATTAFAAIAHSEHLEKRRRLAAESEARKRRRDLYKVCLDFMVDLGHACNESIGSMEAGNTVADSVRPVLAQWGAVEAFEPFSELGDVFQIRDMRQLGAKVRLLEGFAGRLAPHPTDRLGRLEARSDPFGVTPAARVEQIQQLCIQFLPTFHGTLEALDA